MDRKEHQPEPLDSRSRIGSNLPHVTTISGKTPRYTPSERRAARPSQFRQSTPTTPPRNPIIPRFARTSYPYDLKPSIPLKTQPSTSNSPQFNQNPRVSYHYEGSSGRVWPSRDPIGERGGINLYGFVFNSSLGWIDYLGRDPIPIDVGAHDKVPPTDDNLTDEQNKILEIERETFSVHSKEYGNETAAENSADLIAKLALLLKGLEEEKGKCCIETLNLSSHGFLEAGGIAFRNNSNNKADREELIGAKAGEKLGKLLKPLMCSKCQINVRGCSVLAGDKYSDGVNPGSGFGHALAKASGCAVLGNDTGTCQLGYRGRGLKIPTWGNSTEQNVIQINPDGTAQSHLGTGFPDHPRGGAMGEGRFPDALPNSN